MSPNTKFTVLFSVSLLLSFGLGGTLGYLVPHHPYFSRELRGPGGPGGKEIKKRMLEKMSQKLDLTDDQKEKVRAIFEANEPKMRELHEMAKPKFEAIRNATRAEIRALLRPDQIIKFEELNARMDERGEKRRLKRLT